MTKKKSKKEIEEVVIESDILSKKEQYDLEKSKKIALKEKEQKKKNKAIKKKLNTKTNQTNLGARIFAIAMLILMIGSVIASALAYVIG